MPLDPAAQTELSYDPTGALRLELHGPSRRTTVVFTAVWCAGWLLTLASGVLQSIRLGWLDMASLAWIIFWIAGGMPVLLALLWTAGGRREVLTIGGGCFTISRPAGPFRRTRSFDAQAVRNLHSTSALRPLLADGLAIREFWLAGAGPIVFDHDGRRYACGVALDTGAAARVASDLAALLPMATVPDSPAIGPSRLRTWAIAYVATAMLIPAVTVPFRLAVTDRSICFCEDPAPLPVKPVNVSTMGHAGRIHFVPVDGYSPERARAIADHFHRQFGIPVRVERGITTGTSAYDARRGQMNASALLTALEDRYPEGSGRAVVIGLTDADMYIPDANWAYAFSYRRANRIAIVSSARMDRGCLGLLAASDARRLARMRKMIGKNIGVMYYRLPLSRDPRSMLFASIGGPQELDRMSEAF